MNKKIQKLTWGVVILVAIYAVFSAMFHTNLYEVTPTPEPTDRSALISLPIYQPHGENWLRVRAPEASHDNNETVWLAKIQDQEVEIEKLFTSKNEGLATLIDCQYVRGTLCVAAILPAGLEKLDRYTIQENASIFSDTIDIPMVLSESDTTQITALTEEGVLFAEERRYKFYLEKQARIVELFDLRQNCFYPRLSPDGKWLAVLCLTENWQEIGLINPFAPTRQRIHVAKVDGSAKKILETPETYYYNTYTLASPVGFYLLPPVFVWSSDSREIAFVASFKPPKLISTPKENIEYDTFGAIHSISVDGGILSQWTEANLRSESITFAWSPDKKYIAYLEKSQFYITSHDGVCQVSLPDSFKNVQKQSLIWSPDGAYIALLGQDKNSHETVWLLSTQDYSWQRLDIPSEKIYQIMWVTTTTPP